MFDQLKQMAIQQLSQRMQANSLGQNETQEAAQEGGNFLMDLVQKQIAQGAISQVQDLFSKGGQSMEQNGLFQQLQGQLMNVLQNKGMNADEARQEAANTAPDLVNSLRERFESKDEKDSAFDLSQITDMIGGGKAGGLLNNLKNLF